MELKQCKRCLTMKNIEGKKTICKRCEEELKLKEGEKLGYGRSYGYKK